MLKFDRSKSLFALMLLTAFSVTACSTSNKDLGDSEGIVIQNPDGVGQGAPVEGYEGDQYGTAASVGSVDGVSISGDSNQSGLNSYAGDIVFFETDSSNLNPQARAILEQQATWLNNFSNVNITIEGHADERGTREYNLALGDRRASSVKNYLIAMGVDPRRINTVSYGKEQPMVVGDGLQSWSQNRRARTRVQ